MIRQTFKSLRRVAVAIGCLIVFLAPRCPAAPTENEVKAVFLFHLTQFTAWPTNLNPSTEFVIGILGPDPFGSALEAVVKGEKVGDRPIRILRSNRARDLRQCPLVYVTAQAREPLSEIFADLNEPPTLTVGESDGFIEAGGLIRFKRTPENKIRLQVHLSRVRAEGFHISAQLLRVSDVVPGEVK